MALSFSANDKGILPDRMIAALAKAGGIRAHPSLSRPIRFSRRASTCGLAMSPIACARASCRARTARSAERIADLKLHESSLDRRRGARDRLRLHRAAAWKAWRCPNDISASANPKSSTGRLDIFTRVIADATRGFDRVEAGYHGPLYAEICPRTFPVLVREGSRLSQIRFRRGDALLDAEALGALHAQRAAGRFRRRRSSARALRSGVDLSGVGPTSWSAIAPSAIPA